MLVVHLGPAVQLGIVSKTTVKFSKVLHLLLEFLLGKILCLMQTLVKQFAHLDGSKGAGQIVSRFAIQVIKNLISQVT